MKREIKDSQGTSSSKVGGIGGRERGREEYWF
jgi:hypothetical protein